MNDNWAAVISRLERLIDKADSLLAQTAESSENPADSLDKYMAFRWRNHDGWGQLIPVKRPDLVDIADLIDIEWQVEILNRNTLQFLQGLPANHVLLWGDRGTGKSSLVKGILHRYAPDGLRLIEVNKEGLLHLQEITDLLWGRPERYILFCDDLSFSEGEAAYRELKAMLEGGIAARPENTIIYATSNRRHLMPRQVRENQFPSSDEDGVISARINRRKGVLERPIRLTAGILSHPARYLFANCLSLCPKGRSVHSDGRTASRCLGVGNCIKRTIRSRRPAICRRFGGTIGIGQ